MLGKIFEKVGKSNSELSKRVMSALIMIPIAIWIISMGGYIFAAAMVIAATLMAYEWIQMIQHSNDEGNWKWFGLAYICLPIISLMYIRSHEQGFLIIMYLMLTIWATDIGAYFAGTAIGGPKIAPKISPKKSYSGAIGGLIAAFIVGVGFINFTDLPITSIVSTTLLISFLGQIGDLLESALKRQFNVKDSGSLIPGHGGILDRVDSLVIAAPVLTMLI